MVKIPATIPRRKAVNVRASAISIPICDAVRKKTLGFINGEATTKAMMALNGMPPCNRERPTGIAAYVGSGEARPTSAAEAMDSSSFRFENAILRPRKNRVTPTFRAMLMRAYGPTATRRSKKFSRILSV